MTNKKIDIWLRWLLYFMPFIVLIILTFAKIRAEGFNDSNVNQNIFRYFCNQLYEVIHFTSSNTNTLFAKLENLKNALFTIFFGGDTGNVYYNLIVYYVLHIVFVEIVLLIKNVFLFIIRVANNLIERGVEIGK